MDATSNEVIGVKVTYFPTIRLYPKNSEEVFKIKELQRLLFTEETYFG